VDALVVRRLPPDEWQLYQAVRLAALQESPAAFRSTYAQEVDLPEREWRRRLEHGLVLVALLDGEPAGTAGAFVPAAGADAELVGMWVRPDARGLGIGRTLVNGVVTWAHEQGCAAVRLWVVRGHAGAHRLYLRSGFVPTRETQPLPHDPCAEEQRMVRSL
jgi:GNAT superfamily N-acetyltransferase